MPLTRDWQPSKGYLRDALRASQSDCNNIPYIAPPLLAISPQSLSLCSKGRLLRALFGRGPERCRYTNVYILFI